MLSDGLLEPADRKTQPAFQELQTVVRGGLQNLDIFAIALGESNSLKNIPGLNPSLTGLQLMEREIARRSELFTHARQLDQVPDTVLRILKSVKALASPDDNLATYRIDHTVEKLTLIVRKRTVDGKPLASSQDIQLQAPDTAASTPHSAGGRRFQLDLPQQRLRIF